MKNTFRLKSADRLRQHSAPSPAEPNTPNSAGPERISPEWAWHHRTLLHLRERLLQAHAEHAAQASTPPDMRGIDVDESPRDELDRDVLWAALGAEEDKLFEIDSALNRLREGTYGFCEKTGRPIPADRLRAIPWTRYSLAGAEAAERRRILG